MITINPLRASGEISVPLRGIAKNPPYLINGSFVLANVKAQSGAGTSDFDSGVLFLVGSTHINGLFLPEPYLGHMDTLNATVLWGAATAFSSTVTATGAAQALNKARLLMNVPLRAGKKLIRFGIRQLGGSSSSVSGGFAESGANTGAAGTQYFRIRARKMTSGGTLTTIDTIELSSAITSASKAVPITGELSITPYAFSDGDFLVLELEAEVNQTARSSGSAQIATGIGNHAYNTTSANLITRLFCEFSD